MEFPSCVGYELKDLPPVLILVKKERLGCLPPFNIQNTKGLEVLSFLIKLKTEGHCCGVDGYNLSNPDDFGLDIVLSPLPFPSSSIIIYCVSDRLSLCHLETFTSWDGMYLRLILGITILSPCFVPFFALHWAYKALGQ